MALAHADVLFFDVFGTCVDWLHTVRDELRATIRAAPHPDATLQSQLRSQTDWEGFARAWRKGYYTETHRLASEGNPAAVTVDDMHLQILNDLVASTPHLGEAWDDETLARLNTVWHRLRPWPDTPQGLRELKRQFRVGTLTNGNLSLMVDMAKAGDLEWDFILTADLLGSFKPDTQMYKRAMHLMDVDATATPHTAVMVAAHLGDLEHAKRQGMSTVFVQRETEDAIADGDVKPDYVDLVVKDLVELARIAGGLPMA